MRRLSFVVSVSLFAAAALAAGEDDAVAVLTEGRIATDRRIAEIRATPNLSLPTGGSVYYLSPTGDDAKDGLSPATAWRTVQRLNTQKLQPGSFVLFERGGLWRVSLDLPNWPADRPFDGYAGGLRGQKGVTYSAYGKGQKPRLTTSPFNGADASRWQATDVPGVWSCPLGRTDVGCVVFDEGAAHAVKILPVYHKDGRTTAQYTKLPFKSYRDLTGDLHFYHDYATNGIGRGTGLLYLKSAMNPGLRFKSIEFGVRHNIITAHGQPEIVFDNLCLVYGGAHGIHQGGSRDLTVQNCEFGWIGGGIQGEGLFGRNWGVRYGNGVEVGSSDGYVVTNCYFYQIYDAAVTHQAGVKSDFSGTERVLYMRKIRYVANVIEKCNYSIEYFLSRCPEANPSRMEDFVIADNFMWDAGRGLCEQRPDTNQDAHIKSWSHSNRATGYVIRNNFFAGAHRQFVQICSDLKNPDGSDSMPRMEDNVFVGRPEIFGYLSQQTSRKDSPVCFEMAPETAAKLATRGKGNRLYSEPVFERRVSARFAGRDLHLEECRVSAVPMNRVWPGRQRPLDQTKRACFVSFELDRPGEFELSLPSGVSTVEVRPFHRLGGTVKDGVFRIRMEKPEQFVVRMGGTECHVFADAPWRYEPRQGDRYFGPGRHFAGAILPKSGERIVLDRGATVYGNIVMLGVTNVTVEGRGILDSSRIAREDPNWAGCKAAAASALPGVQPVWGTAPVYAYKCGNVTLDGIVFRDAPRWTMNICDCSDVLIDGVKLVGMWRYNSDGIDICACDRTVIRNSFVRAFDDCVIARPQLCPQETTPMRDMVVTNCLLWCDWGRNMKVQHGQRACAMSDIRFSDIDCLNVDASPLVVTTRWGSPGCVISGVSFENIRIDLPADRLRNQYQKKDDMAFVPRKATQLLLGTIDCYSMGRPAPNQGVPGKLDPSFFRLDYSDIVLRGFRVYDRPGHLFEGDSSVSMRVLAETSLPRFRIRELVIEDMPKGTKVDLKGDVNAADPLVADPSVFVSDGRYYLVGTEAQGATGRWFEGDSVFPLLVSDDLVTWREVPEAQTGSRVLRRSEAFGKGNFWAPQLFAHDGRFGFAYTCDFHWGIALSDKPTGPFVRHAEFPKGKGRIDPAIFVDDDKRVWACFSDWSLGGIGLVELSDDLKRFVGEPRLCVRSDQPWERIPLEDHYKSLNKRFGYTEWTSYHDSIGTMEGPSLVKRGGKYVLFYSANDFRSPDYCVGVAVADTLNGPWKKLQDGPVLSRNDTQLAGTGHGDVFSDKTGALWYVFHYHHSARQINTRRTAIVRLTETFDAEGYPHYNADAGSVRYVGIAR